MGLFVTSESAINRHGVFAIERKPPAVLVAPNADTCLMVAQLPWGEDGIVIEPENVADRVNKIAPPGMTRTGSGYLSTIAKAFGILRLVRVLGTTASKAVAALQDIVPATIVSVTALYKGTEGNSIICTVADATDGDPDHFNLTVSVTGASGSTEDLFENLNYSGTGSDSVPTFTDKLLTGSITKSIAGRPLNGSTTMATAIDGTIDSSVYVGTAGTGDKGIALAETDREIRHIFCDDAGNSLRAAVNAGIKAHLTLMGDRNGYLNGDSGMTAANTRTDAANYSHEDLVYADPWVKIYDDVTGAKQLVPPAAFLASVASQVSPSTSIAWKDPEVQKMLGGIVELEATREASAGANTTAGVATIIRESTGGYTIEAGVVTNAPADPTRATLTGSRMRKYMALAATRSLRSYTDAPNVKLNQDEVVTAIDNFLAGLKRAQFTDPNHTPHIIDYNIGDVAAVNPRVDVQAGKFRVPANVTTSAGMENIIFSLQAGESVVVSKAA